MPRITEMYAFVMADSGPDDEGIPAIESFLPDSTGFSQRILMPLVGADLERIDCLREKAQRLANQMGKPMAILRFTERSQIGVIEPEYHGGATTPEEN